MNYGGEDKQKGPENIWENGGGDGVDKVMNRIKGRKTESKEILLT
jgi:hypothetical protein